MIINTEKLLNQYNRGSITKTELAMRLVDAASFTPMADLAAVVIPDEILSQIREWVNRPSGARFRRFSMGAYVEPSDPKLREKAAEERRAAAEREEQAFHAGLDHWRAFLGIG